MCVFFFLTNWFRGSLVQQRVLGPGPAPRARWQRRARRSKKSLKMDMAVGQNQWDPIWG